MKKSLLTLAIGTVFISCSTSPEANDSQDPTATETSSTSQEEESKEAEQANPNAWVETKIVDDFGDDTGKRVFSHTTEGVFSNSATTGSELTIRFVDYGEGEGMKIDLYEYGRSSAALCYDGCLGKISVKHGNGTVHKYEVFAPESGGLYLSDEDPLVDSIRVAKDTGEQLKFVVNQDAFSKFGNSKYQFSLN